MHPVPEFRIGPSSVRIHAYWRTYWNIAILARAVSSFRLPHNGPCRTAQPDYHLDLTIKTQFAMGRGVAGCISVASSLNTIDGGYFGRKIAKTGTIGLFAARRRTRLLELQSNQKIGGMFVNFEEAVRKDTTQHFRLV